MSATYGELVIWLTVGALVGSIAGSWATRTRQGYGLIGNLSLGVLGAILGGALFEVLGINLGLYELKLTVEDLIAAGFGSAVVLLLVWCVTTKRRLFVSIAVVAVAALAVSLLVVFSR